MIPVYMGTATPEEIALAKRIARTNADMTLDGELPQEQLNTNEPMWRLNLRGYLAEMVYCRFFKLESTLREGKLARVDCIQDGKTVDVKTTTLGNGHLCVYREKVNHPADLYVLVIALRLNQVEENYDFYYAGLTTKEELFQSAHWTDKLKPGVWSWVMDQNELWAVEPPNQEEGDAK